MKQTHCMRCARPFFAWQVMLLLWAGLCCADAAVGQTTKVYTVTVEKGPLENALTEVRRITGVVIAYNRNDIAPLQVPAASYWQLSIEEILQRLLTGTTLSIQKNGAAYIVLKSPAKSKPREPGTKKVKLTGRVVDSESQQPVPGATVAFDGRYTLTEENGSFVLMADTGSHVLSVTYVGYAFMSRVIQISTNEPMHLEDWALVKDATNLGAIVVSSDGSRVSQTLHTTEKQIVEQIRQSPTVISAISNQQIVKSFDRSAAEVMRRFAGITLTDNRFIQVRGLDPRYSVTFLNGMPAPSAESDRRAFSYDLVSSNVIDRIVSYKSGSPELYGELTAGQVNIFTKHAVEKRQLDIQLSTQYRAGTTGHDFFTYYGSNKDWLASGAKDRDLPAGMPLPSTTFNDPVDVMWAKKVIKPGYNLQNTYALPDMRLVITYLDQIRLGHHHLNSISLLSYTNAREKNVASLQRLNTASGIDKSNLINQFHNERVAINGMQNFMYPVSKKLNLEWRNLFTRNAEDEVFIREGIVMNRFGGKSIFYQYTQRTLYSTQLAGNLQLGEKGTSSFSWVGGYAATSEIIPNQRDVNLISTLDAYRQQDIDPWTVSPVEPTGYYGLRFFQGAAGSWNTNIGVPADAMRYYRTHEKAWSGTLNYQTLFRKDIKLLAGTYFEQRNRNNGARVIGFRKTNTDVGELEGDFYAPEKRMNDWINADRIGNGFQLNDINLAQSGYRGASKIMAGYITASVPLIAGKLVLHGGIRGDYNTYSLENLKADGTPAPRIDRETGGFDSVNTMLTVNKLYWLPRLNITWHLTEKMQLRASYSRSMNKPEFREASELTYYDSRLDANITGNTSLRFAEIDNYDLRFEYYPAEGQQWMIGGYYKKLKNAIEKYSAAASNFESDLIMFRNTPRTKAYGIEAEVRQSLRFTGVPFFRDFSLIANGSYLFTETRIDTTDGKEALYPTASTRRPMQGAVPYVLNTGLYYDKAKTGTNVAVLLNITGQKLLVAGNYFSADRYELGRTVLDISISQRLNKHVSVKAGVQDLLNQPFQIGRDADGNNKYNAYPDPYKKVNSAREAPDYIEYAFKRGAYYSLGFNFKW